VIGYARTGAIARTSAVSADISAPGLMFLTLNVLCRAFPLGECPTQICIASRHVSIPESVIVIVLLNSDKRPKVKIAKSK
jgi:hypothetical protein